MILANELEKNKCTGCKACEQICPTKCINMQKDKEGFEYPIKDKDKCINCDLCKKVCPIYDTKINKNFEEDNKEIYALRNKDKEIVAKSSSGGAFTSIMEAFCDKNTIIFGVKFDKDFNVVHDYVFNIEDAYIFRKSKYVQSDIGDSYKNVKKFLEEGKKVLFTGTPCQVAGLKKFLNKDYEGLLLIDLVCHGVPSQKVFDKYIEEIKNKYKKKIKSINFREKTYKDNTYDSKNIKIKFDDESYIIENSIENPYLRGYHNSLFLRPSCENCKFANPYRISDITIADCWGIQKLYKDIDVHEGESMIVINSQKGKKVMEKMNDNSELIKLNVEFAIENNGQFREPIKFNLNRKAFFEKIDDMKFSKIIDLYIKRNTIRRLVSKLLPQKVKDKLRKLIYKNNNKIKV